MIHAYNTAHKHCDTVLRAFASGAPVTLTDCSKLREGGAVFYGIKRGSGPLVHQAVREAREWFYCDNGYLKPGHYDGFFRVTRSAYQYTGASAPNYERWRRLGITLDPWRKSGKHIVLCPPGDLYCLHHGISISRWIADARQKISSVTDRQIRVRTKATRAVSLAQELSNAHALVTHSSNSAIEALRTGVPVVTQGACAAKHLATPIESIEQPLYPDREHWFATLAAQQWTLEEFKDGTMWRELHAYH